MALLQLSEPGQSAAPHQHRLAVGIDLGTTNSLVAAVRSGKAVTLPNDDGEHLLPSVVRYSESGIEVGRQAKEMAAKDPLNTIISVKRLIGRGLADIKSLGNQLPYQFQDGAAAVPRIHTAWGDVSSVEVSSEILKSLVRRAESSLVESWRG